MEISRNLWKSEINLAMIFNICPYPEGCVENQFALLPCRIGKYNCQGKWLKKRDFFKLDGALISDL
jgi:hypothetical protein